MFVMNQTHYQTIECPEAKQLIEEANAQLVDVRTSKEHAQGTIPGSVNLPLQVIHLEHGKLDKERPVIVYCRSGKRSAMAKMVLENFGFDAVHNLGAINKYLTC